MRYPWCLAPPYIPELEIVLCEWLVCLSVRLVLSTIAHFYLFQVMKMSDINSKPTLPDHLAGNPRSPHHVAECFEYPIGIRLNGKERTDVEEYCISEGWVKIPSPKALDRRGQPILITLKGTVEAYYI